MTETVPTTPKPAEPTIADGFKAGYQAGANPAPATAAAPAAPTGAGTGVVSNITETAKEGVSVVGDALANPGATLDKAGKKVKGFWDSLTEEGGLGKILGGLLGLGGAWFLGNFFGEGIFGTILTVCLAFPLMAIGSDKLGGIFNGWMGHGKAGNEQAQSPDVSKSRGASAQGQANEQSVAGTGKPLAVSELTESELNAMLERKPTDTVSLVRKANNEIVIETGSADPAGRVSVQELRDILNSGRVGPGQQAAIDFVVFDNTSQVEARFAAVPMSQNSQGRAR